MTAARGLVASVHPAYVAWRRNGRLGSPFSAGCSERPSATFFEVAPDPLAPIDFEARAASGSETDLTVWFAAADPPREGSAIEVRYGQYAEHAGPAFGRAIAAGKPPSVRRFRLKARRFLPMRKQMSTTNPATEPRPLTFDGSYPRPVPSAVPDEPRAPRFRVGIDLVEVDEVAATLRSALGDRYLSRIFTTREVRDCTRRNQVDPTRLAGRFAAKEATMKALRVGDRAVAWQEIEVERTSDGAPGIVLRGAAAALASEAGLSQFAISLTHERNYASAVVVASS